MRLINTFHEEIIQDEFGHHQMSLQDLKNVPLIEWQQMHDHKYVYALQANLNSSEIKFFCY